MLWFAALRGLVAGAALLLLAAAVQRRPATPGLREWGQITLLGLVNGAIALAAMFAGFAGLVLVAVPGGGGDGAVLSLTAAVAITAGTLLSRRRVG